MDASKFPGSGNIDDRRYSLMDLVLTQLRYPLRRDWAQFRRFDDPIQWPQIAADFPMGTGGMSGQASADAGYNDIGAGPIGDLVSVYRARGGR